MTKQNTGRHRTDLISLFFGVLFLAVALWWATSYFLDVTWIIDWDLPDLGWFAAGALILLGVLGLLSTLRRDDPPPVQAPPPAQSPTATSTAPGRELPE